MSKCKVVSSKMSSYGLTTRVVLEEKGVPYEHEVVDPSIIKSDDYLKSNHPFGVMPAFFHGDFHLYETAAIARYVDEAFDGPDLQPDDVKLRAEMQKWISITGQYLFKSVIDHLVLQRLAPTLFGRESDETVIAESMPAIRMQLALIDGSLERNDYLVGDISLADFFVATIVQYIAVIPEGESLLGKHKRITEWVQSVTTRPSYQNASYDLGL